MDKIINNDVIHFFKKNNITNDNTIFLHTNNKLPFLNSTKIGGFCGLPTIDHNYFNNLTFENKNFFIYFSIPNKNDLDELSIYLKDDFYVDNFINYKNNEIDFLVKNINERNDRCNNIDLLNEVYEITKNYLLEITRGISSKVIILSDKELYFNNKSINITNNNLNYLFIIGVFLIIYFVYKLWFNNRQSSKNATLLEFNH